MIYQQTERKSDFDEKCPKRKQEKLSFQNTLFVTRIGCSPKL